MRRFDRGSASLVMLVMFLVLFLAVGLVFDGGEVLATRRQVITAAESSARLAADRADPFSGRLDERVARRAVDGYVAQLGGLRVLRVSVIGARVEVTLEATAHEVFFPMVGLAPAVVTETGSAEVRR